jgi:hypothetical protein
VREAATGKPGGVRGCSGDVGVTWRGEEMAGEAAGSRAQRETQGERAGGRR